MIADGWSANGIAATAAYAGAPAPYEAWDRLWITTYAENGSYDPARAWSEFAYVMSGATDSAAAATALYTGHKTANGNIAVTSDDGARLYTISEKVNALGWASGAVTTVYISHATPGAWHSHNDARGNGYAIADESL